MDSAYELEVRVFEDSLDALLYHVVDRVWCVVLQNKKKLAENYFKKLGDTSIHLKPIWPPC